MSSDATELHIGERLYNAGWRQGSVLRHPSIKFAHNKLAGGNDLTLKQRSIKVDKGECLVVVSQNCDIVAENLMWKRLFALLKIPNVVRAW